MVSDRGREPLQGPCPWSFPAVNADGWIHRSTCKEGCGEPSSTMIDLHVWSICKSHSRAEVVVRSSLLKEEDDADDDDEDDGR